jgi:hypothetical protein
MGVVRLTHVLLLQRHVYGHEGLSTEVRESPGNEGGKEKVPLGVRERKEEESRGLSQGRGGGGWRMEEYEGSHPFLKTTFLVIRGEISPTHHPPPSGSDHEWRGINLVVYSNSEINEYMCV